MSGSTWPPDGASAPAAATAAAVLVPLFERSGELHVVLTRRRADLRRHAGEIAFPGGRCDEEDAGPVATALREAEEEIGLPRGAVRVVGELDDVSTFATGYLIRPVVGVVADGTAWSVAEREVDVVLEPALREISDGSGPVEIERRGIRFTTPAYTVGEHVIWGATARILALLFERLETGPGLALTLPGG